MRIRDVRLEKCISQRELAAAMGIAPNTLSQYENGKREPDLKTLERIADFLNVSVDYLIGRTEKNPTPTNGGGTGINADGFMQLVDKLTPDQRLLLLAQLRAWTESNQQQKLSAHLSDLDKAQGFEG